MAMIYKLGASMTIPTICLEKANFSVHPFGADDFLRYDDLAKEIYQILSNEETLYFIPEKRLVNIEDAKNWLNGAILNFHDGRNAVHFIASNSTGKLVDIIDLIPPAVAREHYQLEDYPYFFEFYLIGDAKGQSIMTNLLPAIVKILRSNGIRKIATAVNRKNHAAGKGLVLYREITLTRFRTHMRYLLDEQPQAIRSIL